DETELEACPTGLARRLIPGGGPAGSLARGVRGAQACPSPGAAALLRLPGERARACAGTGPVHRRREPRELPRWRRAGLGSAAEDQLPGHAASLPSHPAPSVLPQPRGLDPGVARPPRSRRHPAGAPGPRAGRRGGHLPRRAIQPVWAARPGPAGSRPGRPPVRCPRHPRRHLGDVPGAGLAAILPSAPGAARGALREAPPLHSPAPAGDPGPPRRRDRLDHGGDRGTPRRGRVSRLGGRPAMTGPAPKSPWGGRFSEPTDTSARAFTASLPFDHRLWPHDIQGSEAWARALAKGGVLAEAELDAILRGLAEVRAELETGAFPYRIELEDIHMNIERRLIEKIGAVGGKLHTGRSRNDQIALDMRLWLRSEIDAIRLALRDVQAALLEQAERHRASPMPGYTHLQRAQPVLLAHHLLAYVFMLARDRERL